jgi:hypothetical protein
VQFRFDLAVSVPKDPEREDLNEDAFDVSENNQIIALSDGASESYDSKTWARMLVHNFVNSPSFSSNWVKAVQEKYAAGIDFKNLSWSKQMAFERGSFATLITVNCAPLSNGVEVFSIGDSLAVLVRDGRYTQSYPFDTPEQFDARPELLSTLSHLNNFTDDGEFVSNEHNQIWATQHGDWILLVTDAVGQWLLREINHEPSSIELLLQINTDEQFEELVVAMRSERRMKLDDSTMIRLAVVTKDQKNGLPND